MNTPLANATTTAELALAHIMSLARHLPAAQASMRDGKWDKAALVGREITGKTLVVVGLGKIGRILAERALGLAMDVIAFDPFLTGDCPVPGVKLVGFEEALERADFISIHVPKSNETVGMFGREAMQRMKTNACLINCARGGIVVESDLVEALNAGEIAGAALDVFVTEPLPAESPLRTAPNLHLTPHLGASSSEAQKRVSTEIARQMVDYLLHDEARCALNAPTVSPEDLETLRPYMRLGRRTALMLAQVADLPIVKVQITYAGDLVNHGTDPIRLSVLSGLLSPALDSPVNAVNAEMVAAERGLAVLEERSHKASKFSSLLELHVTTADGVEHTIAGTVSNGEPRLALFEGFGVDFVPEGHLLLTRHYDAPGVLGLVATWLGKRGVNIGGLHMTAPKQGSDSALALYETNRRLTRQELVELSELEPIIASRSITL
jgi:D-3-phosphoglycerate dehydrogenase